MPARPKVIQELPQIRSDLEVKNRKLTAEAALIEHKLAIEQGAAVSVEDWEQAEAQAVGAARARLLACGPALGRDLAVETDPMECDRMVTAYIHEALRELTRVELYLESGGTGGTESSVPANDADLGASAESDGQ